ncbi:class E sortase [Corynebacterium sp.]|uniref:class E sortase n=1 Tax=Corynebacterium sp. TaxID=1720 RepID=UPI0026DC213F|nr:class E sortase [Corynebacterium sp.]MDO5032948.1 class E sortase [Corynebacterium sp.]
MKKARVSTVIGELLLTLGVLLLLFAFYEAYWTNLESGKLQEEASDNLEQQWRNPRGTLTPQLGEAFARMYIPVFGADYNFAILEGTDDADLLRGPGRYVESQLPGETGNFAVAGHRVGKGAPFNDLANLRTCDAIVVETQTEWITYRVLPVDASPAPCLSEEQRAKPEYAALPGREITTPGDIGVIAPVPGSEAAPSEALLTLTTCHPQFSNAERMIVHAMAVEKEPKIAGQRPAVLEER